MTRRVKCEDCASYKFYKGIELEPKGGCESEVEGVLLDYLVMDYNGKNWRANQRNSKTPRRCKGFTLAVEVKKP